MTSQFEKPLATQFDVSLVKNKDKIMAITATMRYGTRSTLLSVRVF